MMEEEEDIKLKDYSSEAEEGCCFCFNLYSDFSQNDTIDSGSPEYIYSSCSHHINSEYLNKKFLTWSSSLPLPFCKKCFGYAEKLSTMNSQLEEIQKQIKNFVDTFTTEFLESRKFFNKDICTESDIENWFVSQDNQVNSQFLESDIFSESVTSIKQELEESAESFVQSELSNFDLEDHFSSPSNNNNNNIDIPVPVADLKPRSPTNDFEGYQKRKIKSKVVSKPRNSIKSRRLKEKLGKTELSSIQVNLRRMEFDSEGNHIPFTELLPRRKAAIKAEETFLSFAGLSDTRSVSGFHSNESEMSDDSTSSWEKRQSLQRKHRKSKPKLVSYKSKLNVKSESEDVKTNSGVEECQQSREKKFQCNLCEKRFFRKRHMRDHEMTHDRSKRFQCHHCDMSYAYSRNLRQHIQKHENGEFLRISNDKKDGVEGEVEADRSGEEKLPSSPDERKFKCPECSKTYKTKYHLNEHERTHFKDKRFQCTYCDMSYAYVRNLRDHLLKRHKKVYPRKKGGRPPGTKKEIGLDTPKSYVCKVCDKICNTAGHLFYHRKSHLGTEGEMKCETCNKLFKNVVTLTKHQKIHTDQSRYLCSICGKEFKSKTGRRDHERCHSDEKRGGESREKFECPECHKMYSSRSSLNLHSLRHREVKEFVCAENGCGKRFSTKGGLNCHAMYHRGEKPYLCEECGKSFYTATKLKAHNRLHTGLLFPCHYCHKGFQTTTHLKQHYRSHNRKSKQIPTLKLPPILPRPIQSFPCPTCLQVFTSENDFQNHTRQVHEQDLITLPPPSSDEFTHFFII